MGARSAVGATTVTCDVEATVLALFDAYQRPLQRYAMSMGVPLEEAEDVVQEAFVALFRHLQLGRPRQHLAGWLFQVTHNLVLKHRRAHRRRSWWRQSQAMLANDLVDPAVDPETRLAEAQQRVRWQRVLQALPDRDRRCVLLRAEGLTYRTIAIALNVSLGTVAQSMARALDRLARTGDR